MYCKKSRNEGVGMKATAPNQDQRRIWVRRDLQKSSGPPSHSKQIAGSIQLQIKQTEVHLQSKNLKRKNFSTVSCLPSLYLRHNEVHKVQINPSVIPFNAQNTALSRPLYQLLLLPITASQPSSCSPQRLNDQCC